MTYETFIKCKLKGRLEMKNKKNVKRNRRQPLRLHHVLVEQAYAEDADI